MKETQMKIEKTGPDAFVVTMTSEEKSIIINCVNYLCHGARPKAFHALIGVDWEEAAELLPILASI